MNISLPVCRFALALLASPFAISAWVAPVSPSGASCVRPIVQVAANKSDQTARRQQSAPTHCAEVYRYWSTRHKKCMDARDKPSVPGRKGAEPGCMRGKAGC
jgi:hypothetical protein